MREGIFTKLIGGAQFMSLTGCGFSDCLRLIDKGQDIFNDVLADKDRKPIVKISTVDAYGYSVVYYDGIRK